MHLAAQVAPAPALVSGSACEASHGTLQAQVPSRSYGAERGDAVGPAAAKGRKQNDCSNSQSSNGQVSNRRTTLHVAFLILGVLLLALLTATAAARSGLYRFDQVSKGSSSSSSKQARAGLRWGEASSSSASYSQAVAGSRQKSFSRHLLQNRWSLLGLRSNLLTGGILQQLLTASVENDKEAASAAMAAASLQGRASRLLLTDLDSSTSAPGGQAPPRFLATAAQGPRGTAGQAMVPIDTDAQPLCSATINYGASVGDASNEATADVPIYVGSFDVVVTQPQSFEPPEPVEGDGSRWVIGWQFAAGEYLQVSRDVFGDEGIQQVFMSPSAQGPAESAEEVPGLPPSRGTLGQTPQRVAVFSNTSLGGYNGEVVFSFVGRKGPERPILPTAPFRVAPPSNVFLNNHYCWPLFRPSGSSGSSPAAIAAAAGSGAAVGKAPGAQLRVPGQAPEQQMRMVEVATPQLEPANMPRQLQVEYLPVEFAARDDDPALFAKTVTQFYFKMTNQATEAVFLDQVLLQYWFHGPLDGTLEDSPDNSTAASTPGVTDVAARVSTSQFRLTCSDASPDIGCGGLAWNVTPGLPSAFGARYILNIWFPAPFASSNGSSNSSDGPQRFVLLPAGGNSSASSNSTVGEVQAVTGSDGKPLLQQSLTDMQAIVAIEPRRFFANISATNDYSFADTPVLGPPAGTNSSAGDGGQLVRRRREPNSRMPAYVSQKLAWGSPPVGGRMAPRPGSGNSTVGAKSIYPPGSYCQPSAGGGLVCGIDVLYCCLGSGALNLTSVPPDWPTRLTSGLSPVIGATGISSNLTSPGGLDPGASSKGSLDSWALALAVSLPIAAVLAAAAAGGMVYVRRRRRAANRFKPFAAGSDHGSQDGGDVLTGLQRPAGPPGPASLVAMGGAGAGDNPSLLAALLSPHGGQQGPGWTGAGLDAAERGHGVMYGPPEHQQLAGWQLIHAQQAPASTTSEQGGSLTQLQYTAAMSAAAAAAPRPQRQLLRVLKPKVPSLPGDMFAAAARFAKQHHLGSRLGDDGNGPGSPFAEASHTPIGGFNSSQDAEDAVEQGVRCHTWTGCLHEDAFGDDLLDQLLNIHMRPKYMATAAAPSSPTDTEGVWSQLQQQQGQHPINAAGAAAAAVEAAVAAINALLSGTAGMPRPPAPALSRYPGRAKKSSSAGDRPGSPQGPAGTSPSFYKALMATGGVLRPPGGPPIPLNVDYASEIQPKLGRLLGRGGFGHVYEGTWRGQRVAVKLLTVDTEDPAVLDAFLKEVALCACLRGCDRVVRLLGACLGSCGAPPAQQPHPPPSPAGTTAAGSTCHTSSTHSTLAAVPGAGTMDVTPFQSQLPPDVAADDTPRGSTSGARQQPQQQWALIMELVEGGNLAQRIYHPSKRSLSYLEILQVGLDIASGLAYLHPAVVHRDLKPQNVLLDKQGRAKIADFGISRFKDPHRSYLSVTHQGGTPNYMAPELFNASRVDEAADVYSLGCILYECLAKQQPFSHLAEDGKSFNVLYKIIVAVAINKERPPLPHDTPPRLASLILRCWTEHPAGRPRVDELLAELEDMMREALQERAERTGQLRRMSSISSRSHSLPNQQCAARKDSTGSITSNSSSNSPSQAGRPVRGAHTLPAPVPPHNSLASSLAPGSEGNATGSMWPPPLAGSHSDSQHSSALSRCFGTGANLVPTLPSEVMQLPSLGAATAAQIRSRAPSSRRSSLDDAAAAAAAQQAAGGSGFLLCLQTGAAAALTADGSGQAGATDTCRGSNSSEVDQAGPSSPRPFQEQQMLVLHHHHQQQQQQQHQQHSHHVEQQQQLRPSGSVASSGYSRPHWQCACLGSPEPCAACAGSTSSSDCGSSNGGCGSSGGSMHRTPSSISPVHMSPTTGRQLHVLPEIPQGTSVEPVQLPSYAAAAAAGNAEENSPGVNYAAVVQLSSLQPPLLRPKASIASPQTPARSAHVGRKPSHLSGHASGALFTTTGSLPAVTLGTGPGSSDLQYPLPASASATAYPALLYPLHADILAAAAAEAVGGQPAAVMQSGLVRSSSGGSSSRCWEQQQSGGLPRQPSGVLPRPSQHPVASGSHTGANGGSSGSGGPVVAAGSSPPAAASLSNQRAGVLPRHSRGDSSGSSNSSADSIVPRGLHTSHFDTAHQLCETAVVPQQAQQQELPVVQQLGGSTYSSSSVHPKAYDHEQQQGGTGLVRPSSSPHLSMARSASSVPSEPAATGELSGSQSSSPSAVTASAVAASVYSCGSDISSSCNASRLRSASLDFSTTSLYSNPLFGLGGKNTWQLPALQMQHSAPAMGRAGRSLAAAAVERSARSVAAAAAAAEHPAGSVLGQGASAHNVPRHPSQVDGADSGTASSTTVFMTAKSATAGAGASADAAAAAVDGLGDCSLHGNGSGHVFGTAGPSRLARASSDTVAMHARNAGNEAVAAVSAGISSGVGGQAEAVAAAAATGHAGHAFGVAVARKVSFADADEVVG